VSTIEHKPTLPRPVGSMTEPPPIERLRSALVNVRKQTVQPPSDATAGRDEPALCAQHEGRCD